MEMKVPKIGNGQSEEDAIRPDLDGSISWQIIKETETEFIVKLLV